MCAYVDINGTGVYSNSLKHGDTYFEPEWISTKYPMPQRVDALSYVITNLDLSLVMHQRMREAS